jgi:hypothetical protein
MRHKTPVTRNKSPLLWASFYPMLVAGALCLGTTSANAQVYPVKPVRIFVGFAGGSELMARVVAQQLSPVLGAWAPPATSRSMPRHDPRRTATPC